MSKLKRNSAPIYIKAFKPLYFANSIHSVNSFWCLKLFSGPELDWSLMKETYFRQTALHDCKIVSSSLFFICSKVRHYVFCISLYILFTMFSTNNQVHSYNTRIKYSSYLHYCKTNIKKFYIRFQGPKLHNFPNGETKKASSILSLLWLGLEHFQDFHSLK